jgi:hypothetical protein
MLTVIKAIASSSNEHELLPKNKMTVPRINNKIAIIVFLSWFILGFSGASYSNGTNFQVEMPEPGKFRITSLRPGPISTQAMGKGSNYLLNCWENGKMVTYAWVKPGGTLLVSSGHHQLRITVDNDHQYKIEEDPQ